jgi:hypothetical protein
MQWSSLQKSVTKILPKKINLLYTRLKYTNKKSTNGPKLECSNPATVTGGLHCENITDL